MADKPSPLSAIKISRHYGYSPQAQRIAVIMMKRRGMSHKSAVRTVAIVNAATAAERKTVLDKRSGR